MDQSASFQRRGAAHYLMRSLADPCASTLVDEISRLRAAVRAVHRAMPFRIEAWVVLPDHLHTVWTLPDGDDGVALRWQAIARAFAADIPNSALTPWQNAVGRSGFWSGDMPTHRIEDRAMVATYRRDCWSDPVRHGFVTQAQDWPNSSYHRDAACLTDAGDGGDDTASVMEPARAERAHGLVSALPDPSTA